MYELLLATGKRVIWEGSGGLDACQRYVDAHRTSAVVAWRAYPRHGVFVSGTKLPTIIE